MKLYKSAQIPSKDFAVGKIQEYQTWISRGCIGANPLIGLPELNEFVSGEVLEFINETKQEIELNENQTKLESDIEYFKNIKVRPIRDQKLFEWVDIVKIRDLEYTLTSEQEAERETCRQDLLNFPSTISNYMEDSELDNLILSMKPSYI